MNHSACGGSSLSRRTRVDEEGFLCPCKHRRVILAVAIGVPPRFTVSRFGKHPALLGAAAVALHDPAATCPSQGRADDFQIAAEGNEQPLGEPLGSRRNDNHTIATGDVLSKSFHAIVKPAQALQASLETRRERVDALLHGRAIKSVGGNPQQDGRARASRPGEVKKNPCHGKDRQ